MMRWLPWVIGLALIGAIVYFALRSRASATTSTVKSVPAPHGGEMEVTVTEQVGAPTYARDVQLSTTVART